MKRRTFGRIVLGTPLLIPSVSWGGTPRGRKLNQHDIPATADPSTGKAQALTHGFIDSRFSSDQARILEQAANIVSERFLDKRIIGRAIEHFDKVRIRTPWTKDLYGGYAGDKIRSTLRHNYFSFIYERLSNIYDWRAICLYREDSGESWVGRAYVGYWVLYDRRPPTNIEEKIVHIRSEIRRAEREESQYGKMLVVSPSRYIVERNDDTLANVTIKGRPHSIYNQNRFHVEINGRHLGSRTGYAYGGDPEYWAGVLAHEMLHNLGLRHRDGEYDGTFIRSYQRAVQTNGRWRPGLSLDGGAPFSCDSML